MSKAKALAVKHGYKFAGGAVLIASSASAQIESFTGTELAGTVTLIGAFLAIAVVVTIGYTLFMNGKQASKMVRK